MIRLLTKIILLNTLLAVVGCAFISDQSDAGLSLTVEGCANISDAEGQLLATLTRLERQTEKNISTNPEMPSLIAQMRRINSNVLTLMQSKDVHLGNDRYAAVLEINKQLEGLEGHIKAADGAALMAIAEIMKQNDILTQKSATEPSAGSDIHLSACLGGLASTQNRKWEMIALALGTNKPALMQLDRPSLMHGQE